MMSAIPMVAYEIQDLLCRCALNVRPSSTGFLGVSLAVAGAAALSRTTTYSFAEWLRILVRHQELRR